MTIVAMRNHVSIYIPQIIISNLNNFPAYNSQAPVKLLATLNNDNPALQLYTPLMVEN